jgi:dipeptidase E
MGIPSPRVIVMKFYLSSFKLGKDSKELVGMTTPNKKMGFIPNAADYTKANIQWENEINNKDMAELKNLGLDVQLLDLREYFGKTDELRKKISELGAVFVRGGNTFVLRQAMRLSGFDTIFQEILKRDDFVYAGYSAGICVLSGDIRVLQTVDDPNDKPYPELRDTIWEGLGYLDYIIIPHYKSYHPESALVDKLVEQCQKNGIPFKTLRDGEVILIE